MVSRSPCPIHHGVSRQAGDGVCFEDSLQIIAANNGAVLGDLLEAVAAFTTTSHHTSDIFSGLIISALCCLEAVHLLQVDVHGVVLPLRCVLPFKGSLKNLPRDVTAQGHSLVALGLHAIGSGTFSCGMNCQNRDRSLA